MNRLQKKCLIAAAGTHFLLVVLLFCSAFVRPTPKPDNSPVLEMIPSTVVERAANTGGQPAPTPPPAPPVRTPEPPQPAPEPPKPETKPVEPPKPVQDVKPPEAPAPEPPTPEPSIEKPKPKPHPIEINLKPVVRKQETQQTNNHEAEEQAKAAAAAAKAAKARARALKAAANSIREDSAQRSEIQINDESGESAASYDSVVKSIYFQRWILPDTVASDSTRVKVSVTIQRDGRVTDAHIVDPSADSSVNTSVQRALDRVSTLPAFPDGMHETERTYIIYFDLGTKRQMLG